MRIRILLLSIMILSVVIGCKKTDNATEPLKTLQITEITPDSAEIGGSVSLIGTGFGATQSTSNVSFNNVKAINYTSWSDTQIKVNVPNGANSGKVSVTVNGKKSNEVEFKVLISAVTISNLVWMLYNLDVDHYRNGDSIPEVRDSAQWINLTTGAWCYYNNEPSNGPIYGKLYNWYAVNDPRGLAPLGWHVPTQNEWRMLTTFLGGDTIAGGKLKETDTLYWHSPNTGATNSSGFTALPGGYRNNESFIKIGYLGHWWSSSEVNLTIASSRLLYSNYPNSQLFNPYKNYGLSVRCVKDY